MGIKRFSNAMLARGKHGMSSSNYSTPPQRNMDFRTFPIYLFPLPFDGQAPRNSLCGRVEKGRQRRSRPLAWLTDSSVRSAKPRSCGLAGRTFLKTPDFFQIALDHPHVGLRGILFQFSHRLSVKGSSLKTPTGNTQFGKTPSPSVQSTSDNSSCSFRTKGYTLSHDSFSSALTYLVVPAPYPAHHYHPHRV